MRDPASEARMPRRVAILQAQVMSGVTGLKTAFDLNMVHMVLLEMQEHLSQTQPILVGG